MKKPIVLAVLMLVSGLGNMSMALAVEIDSGTQQTTMVELFTSQGCSSCPPAESWLNSLAEDRRLWKEVVPLAFHVDYWDYLGWRDPYAKPDFSDRQRQYRQHGKVRAVYTPGFVVNGKEWKGWFSRDQLPVGAKSVGRLVANIDGKQLDVTFSNDEKPLNLNIAVLGFGIRQPVVAGENEGKTLPQEFVVLGHEMHQSDSGQWQVRLPQVSAQRANKFAVALWVTAPGSLQPLQAAGGWLPANVIPIQ
jgi:hypothetical protein